MSENNTSSLKAFITIAALIPTAFTAFTGYLAYQLKKDTEILKTKRDYNFQIYNVAKEALSGSEKEQIAAIALIKAIGEEPLKSALLEAYEDSANSTPEIIQIARESLNESGARNKGSKTDLPNWGDIDFDLFHCESSSADATLHATRMKQELEKDGARGRIRVRQLSLENEKRYDVSGYEIRPNSNEIEIAEKLKLLFIETTPAANPENTSFRISGQNTPWYLSMFFCP